MERTDYEEPSCPFDNSMWVKKEVASIPTGRVIAKEDEYLSKNDYASAERHLLYWLAEAETGHDRRGKLVLCNELMGLHRKLGNGDKAKEYAQKALTLVDELEFQDMISGATTFLNAGTVCKAFSEPERSLSYFEKAKDIYEKELEPGDSRKAGLYNNMALTLADLGRYVEARDLYSAAIDIVSGENSADEAITWLNIADCAVLEKGEEGSEPEVQKCLDRADDLLDGIPETERDGYYAFVCEKCAPVFDHYGYFLSAKKFRDRAAAIYSDAQK